MRELKRSRFFAAFLIFTTCLLPAQKALAADPIPSAKPTRGMHDIALGRAGTLSGQLIDESGVPLASQRIIARGGAGQPIAAVSDRDGRFTLTGLRGGLYEISTERSSLACRCWTPNAAPPRALKEVLLVAERDVERGQRPIADLLTGPVLIGLIIAAAIAIPIAVHNSQKSAS
jgi:hypothetical protein